MPRDRRRLAYQLGCGHHAIELALTERANHSLNHVYHKRPLFTAGSLVRVYNIRVTAPQSNSRAEDDREPVLRAKFSLNLTGPSKVSRVGSSESAPDGKPGRDEVFVRNRRPVRDAPAQFSFFFKRCKPCMNPYCRDHAMCQRVLPNMFLPVSLRIAPFHNYLMLNLPLTLSALRWMSSLRCKYLTVDAMC